MKAAEVTTNLETLSNFLIDNVIGKDKNNYSDEFYLEVDEKGYEIIQSLVVEEFMPLYKKITGVNILDKNTSYSIFEKLPKIWKLIHRACIEISVTER